LRARISTNWSRPAGRRHACATGRGLALGGGGAAGGRGRHAARATRLRPAARRDAQGSARQRALIYGSRPWARRHEWPSWHAARPAVAAIVPAHGFSRVVGVGSYTSWELQTEYNVISFTIHSTTRSLAYKAVLSTIRNAAMPHAWAPALTLHIYLTRTSPRHKCTQHTVIGVRRDDDTPL
jgi:hypothetical protein